MKIITADHVLPISSPPIRDGAVVIDGSSIAAVGRREDVAERYPGIQLEDLGEAAILPGFVNCHSHLEITGMRGALDDVEHDFRAWLMKLTALREQMSDAQIEDAAFHGAMEGAQAGVTCFGDIGRYGIAGLNALKRAGLRGVLFQETEFSPDDRTAEADFEILIAKFESLRNSATDLVEVGLSPHSPYTVSPKLFGLIAEYAEREGAKVTVHASESAEEDQLLSTGTGFFAQVYGKYDVQWNSPRCSPIQYLERTGILKARPVLAHCVTVSDADIDIIAASGSRVAHCPKSNAKFAHGYAPLEKLIDAGVPVGLGSDSVASNNLCDLLEEARFAVLAARNRPGRGRFISAGEVLRAATLGGAEVLGLDDRIGTLQSGKEADITIVSLGHVAQRPVNDVEAAIVFSSNSRDVIRTIVAGEDVFTR